MIKRLLQALKGLFDMNMPIALFGKVEQHNYYHPVIVKDVETALDIAQQLPQIKTDIQKEDKQPFDFSESGHFLWSMFTLPFRIGKFLLTSNITKMSLLVALGVGAGFFLQNTSLLPSRSTRPSLLPDTVPAPSVQTEELLADFVTRESQRLTAEERFKLTAVTDKVLMGFYDTPAEMREEFRYERLKAGLDSRAFNDFNNKWQAKITAMQIEDSATSMRRIFEALRSGLQSVKSTIDFSDIDFSGEPVEAFEKVPLERNRTIADADVPVTPEVLSEKKTFFLSSPSGRSENVSRKRIFRIRRQ